MSENNKKEVRVNVWKVGYTNIEDYKNNNKNNAVCKQQGYVKVNLEELWEEEVWRLLNWGAYSTKKPKNVYSDITHCNSDVIFHIKGTDEWLYAKSIGFGHATSLKDAIEQMKKDTLSQFWAFPEART
ncbi:MAG: hypothetical protein IKO36_10905 [Bacteroidaceae bacterium]|nr:hypothetical protein [Bacteroidaceae bacterium]